MTTNEGHEPQIHEQALRSIGITAPESFEDEKRLNDIQREAVIRDYTTGADYRDEVFKEAGKPVAGEPDSQPKKDGPILNAVRQAMSSNGNPIQSPFLPSADLVERPLNLYADLSGETQEDSIGVDPSGPWVAIALRDGNWITGELVSDVSDVLTIRNIFSVRTYLVDVLDDNGERQYTNEDGEVVDINDVEADAPLTWMQQENHAVQMIDSTVSMDLVYTINTFEGSVWSDQSEQYKDELEANADSYGMPGFDPRTGFPTRRVRDNPQA